MEVLSAKVLLTVVTKCRAQNEEICALPASAVDVYGKGTIFWRTCDCEKFSDLLLVSLCRVGTAVKNMCILGIISLIKEVYHF